MKASEVINACFSALDAKDLTKAGKLLSDKLEVVGVAPEPQGKNEFINVHRALFSGIPDFNFHHKIIKENGNRLGVKVQITGTHTKEMTAPIPGLKNIPATWKAIKMPEEECDITVTDDKITRLEIRQVPGGGIAGLLNQIGVKLPTEATL
jgi:predicted ester cyclase